MSFFIFLWLANNEKGSSKAGKNVELERVNVNKGDTKRAKRGSLELVEAGQTARKKQTQRLVFPCEAQLRPDRILYFIINKLLVPVPWESRIDEAYERKNWNTANYVIIEEIKDGLRGAILWKQCVAGSYEHQRFDPYNKWGKPQKR